MWHLQWYLWTSIWIGIPYCCDYNCLKIVSKCFTNAYKLSIKSVLLVSGDARFDKASSISTARSSCSPPGGCCILQVWRSENTSHFSSIIATAFLTGLRIVYFLFLLRFLCVYIQVPSACAQSWYESDRLAWRASERPLACPSGQTTTPLHWCSLVCCRGPSGGTTNSNAKQ